MMLLSAISSCLVDICSWMCTSSHATAFHTKRIVMAWTAVKESIQYTLDAKGGSTHVECKLGCHI